MITEEALLTALKRNPLIAEREQETLRQKHDRLRNETIVRMYTRDVNPMTVEDIAEHFGLTCNRIKQIVANPQRRA